MDLLALCIFEPAIRVCDLDTVEGVDDLFTARLRIAHLDLLLVLDGDRFVWLLASGTRRCKRCDSEPERDDRGELGAWIRHMRLVEPWVRDGMGALYESAPSEF